MQFKGVLFDLDGTLLDTSALIIQSVQHTVRMHGNRETDPDLIRTYFGKPLRSILNVLIPDGVEEAVETYHEYNLLYHDQLARIFPGVPEVIAELYSQDIRMAIVTSKIQSTAFRGLKLFGLDQYFSSVIGYEQCRQYKPHPEPVRLAAAGLGLKPHECLVIGDSPFDILSGKEAGSRTAAAAWTEVSWQAILAAKPDYILDDISHLPLLIGSHKAKASED